VIVAVTGTGTGIGKTHLACALVGGLRDRDVRAVGWKPVESGVATDPRDSDEALLRASSGEQPIPPTLRLRAAVSPHLAARLEGKTIDRSAIRGSLDALASRHDVIVLELAGGLCSPFDDEIDNIDFLAALQPRTILVASDRLGVLHDVSAALRAARAVSLHVHAVALVAPETADESTGSNALEIRARHAVALLEVPRAPIAELRRSDRLVALAR
jgi:dethiobiotin synthetase